MAAHMAVAIVNAVCEALQKCRALKRMRKAAGRLLCLACRRLNSVTNFVSFAQLLVEGAYLVQAGRLILPA